MKKRLATILGVAVALVAAAPTQRNATSPVRPAALPLEKELVSYLEHFLPYNPDSSITVVKSSEIIPGFQAFQVQRKGKYEKLNTNDRVVYVSEDGRRFFAGEKVANTEPGAVRGSSDLSWLDSKFSNMFRSRVRAVLVPERDTMGMKGVALTLETGYFQVRLPGYVTPDGRYFL